MSIALVPSPVEGLVTRHVEGLPGVRSVALTRELEDLYREHHELIFAHIASALYCGTTADPPGHIRVERANCLPVEKNKLRFG